MIAQKFVLKKQLFEYVVFKLDQWYRETNYGKPLQITKLRLQKVLFLLCAVNATKANKGLLTVFNNFVALPYGPVEMDIYEVMNGANQFKYLSFVGNDCKLVNMSEGSFTGIDASYRVMIDAAVKSLRAKKRNYLTMPIFDLVELTHQWSVWQTAQLMAGILGRKSEDMSADDICNSIVKAY